MSAEKELAYWINERWAIHIKKDVEGLPKPWSTDPIFQRVRFCNVHREHDAVTKWMRENWSTAESPAWWFVLGRMLNHIPTLESIVNCGGRGDDLPPLDGLRDGLKATRLSGEKTFTSAYTISTCGKKMDKIDYVIGVCRDAQNFERGNVLRDGTRDWPDFRSLKYAHETLMEIDGLGSFLAAQVVADMKNTKGHPLADAPDWWTWSASGPGSLRGLNWFFYHDPDGPITAAGYDNAIRECWEKTWPLVNLSIPRIGMQDFQNTLCEFSKYMKVKHLNGHARNKYAGV